MNYLRRAWRGEEKLSRVVLLIGVLGNIAALLAVAAVQEIALNYGVHGETYTGVGRGGVPYVGMKYLLSNVLGIVLLTYFPFSMVCIWRCAKKAKTSKYQAWARQLVIIVAILAAFHWLGFLLVESQ